MEHIYLKNVVTLEVDQKTCIGCGMCIIVCPHAVLSIKDKKAEIVNRDKCMECGACTQNCPVKAVTVESGVGCAAAIITGAIKGTEPVCGCGETTSQSCC